MRVRFNKSVIWARGIIPANTEADVHPELAQDYIRAGYAVSLEKEIETAVPIRPAERAVRPLRGAQRGI